VKTEAVIRFRVHIDINVNGTSTGIDARCLGKQGIRRCPENATFVRIRAGPLRAGANAGLHLEIIKYNIRLSVTLLQNGNPLKSLVTQK
jgi:hypothetical protein